MFVCCLEERNHLLSVLLIVSFSQPVLLSQSESNGSEISDVLRIVPDNFVSVNVQDGPSYHGLLILSIDPYFLLDRWCSGTAATNLGEVQNTTRLYLQPVITIHHQELLACHIKYALFMVGDCTPQTTCDMTASPMVFVTMGEEMKQ